ncbi:MAG: Rrf2 family transcriptional regulator [Sphingorhabdus sp.]
MRINKGVEWAVHACVLLAPLPNGRGLSLAALAEYHGLPVAYMAKQMQALSRAGIVRTFKGKTGGYALARLPSKINLWDIMRAIDGPAPMFRCTEIRQAGPCANLPDKCKHACPIASAFAKAEQGYRAALREVSLVDILTATASAVSPDHIGKVFGWFSENTTTLPTP